MANNYLDPNGVLYLWQKFKGLLPTKVSELTNDKGYLTEHQDISGKLDKTGNAVDVTVTFNDATSRTNIVSGEKLTTLFGKISKWFTDLKTVAFTGNYNDLNNTPTIPTKVTDLSDASEYTTTTQVNSMITGKGYQTATDVNNAIDVKGYQTATQVNSAIISKGYQTEAQVTTLINNAMADISGIEYQVVGDLPTTGEAGVIYLVSNSGTNPNAYDEYIYVGGKFEKIGSTETDLSGYMKTTDMVAITNAELDTICV